jgi:hypothetical protein
VRDTSMDDLIRKTVSTGMREPSSECADENVMAAYLEGNLSVQEKAAFEEHASRCSSCQEILALSIKLQNPEATEQASQEKSAGKRTLFRFSIPIPVLGGVAAIVLIVVLFRFFGDSQQKLSTPQVAELHPPAREAEVMKPNAPMPQPVENKSSLVSEPPAARISIPGEKLKGAVVSELQSDRQAIPSAAPVVKTEEAKTVESRDLIGETKVAEVPATEVAVAAHSRSNEKLDAPSAAGAASDQMDKLQNLALNAVLPPPPSPRPQKAKAVESTVVRTRSDATGSRQIGEKVFYRDSGIWIDRQCAEHPNDPVVEIKSEATEYKSILEQYPELRDLLPAKIYWNGKTYLLR